MSDVDLLTLDDWHASETLLLEAGFRRLTAGDHAAALADPETGATLELHLAPVSCPGLFPIDPEGLWQRSVSGPGQVPRLPAPEDLLVHLALHAGFQHGLILTLGQHLDLRRAGERLVINASRLEDLARRSGAEIALAVCLLASQIVVGHRLSKPLEDIVARHLPRRIAGWRTNSGKDPLTFVFPAPTPLGRVRWALAPGRRLTLLWRTAFARPLGAGPRSALRPLAVLQRLLRLALSGLGEPGPGRSRSA
jgi:hypothetical protein